MSDHFKGAPLPAWRKALEPTHSELANQLQEEVDPYQTLIEIGLPVPPYIAFDTIRPFLANPDAELKSLLNQGIESFYVGLRPNLPDLSKFRELGLDARSIVTYIRKCVPPANYDDYYLRVAEYAPAQYGVVAIINPSGRLRLEMVSGEMSNLATGHQTPEFIVEADQFTGILRYSFENIDLRKAVYEAIDAMSLYGEDNDSCHPARRAGYYEFVLVNRGERLRPVFFDYKNSTAFTIPE